MHTELGASGAVDVKGEIASAFGASDIGKDQAVRAEFLLEDKVGALVVAVALDGIGKDAVLLRAVAILGVDCERENKNWGNSFYRRRATKEDEGKSPETIRRDARKSNLAMAM